MAILGTPARPAIVRVATIARAEAVRAICASKGWRVIAGVEPDSREDLTDLELLLMGGQAIRTKIDRNAPCPSRSRRSRERASAASG